MPDALAEENLQRALLPPQAWVGSRHLQPNYIAAASSSATSPARHCLLVINLVASAAGMPMTAPIAAGVVMPQSCSAWPTSIREPRLNCLSVQDTLALPR